MNIYFRMGSYNRLVVKDINIVRNVKEHTPNIHRKIVGKKIITAIVMIDCLTVNLIARFFSATMTIVEPTNKLQDIVNIGTCFLFYKSEIQ